MEKKLFLSILSGIAISLAFPPLQFGFMVYWGFIPFLVILQDTNYKQAIKWAYLTGFFLNLGTLYWIYWPTIPGVIAAILYLPIYFVLFAILHTFLRRRLSQKYLFICIPFLWTGIEYIRSLGVLGFPWTSLAYTQTYYLSLIQYASYTSLYGVSFWIITINVVIWVTFKNYNNLKKIIICFLFLISLFILPWLYGKIIIPREDTANEKIRIALIQGNIDPYIKSDADFWEENMRIYDSLSRQAAEEGPQLLIWPETAVPYYLRYTNSSSKVDFKARVRELSSELNIPIITGAHDAEFLYDRNEYLTFNAVFLIEPNSFRLPAYAKLHLVPFGERVPFTEVFPILKDFLESLEMGQGNFSPGNKINTFKITISKRNSTSQKQIIKAPVIICFESLFPELVRKFVIDKNAHLLVIITNDGWFKRSSAPYHHAQVAILRAIENGIPIARCANTGISMFIDSYGRTIDASPLFERLYICADIPLRDKNTFFSLHGNIFSITVTILNLGPIMVALVKKNHEVNDA